MNLIERAKNILFTPKTEWAVVAGETATPVSVMTSYVIPMAIVSALGGVISYFMLASRFGYGTSWMIATVVIGIIVSIGTFFLTALIVDLFAPSFGSEKNMGRSAQLVAYSFTPVYIGGLLSFIPIIGWLILLAAAVYAVYLLYLGLGPLKNTPEDKKVVYILVVVVIACVAYFVLAAILGVIILSVMGIGAVSTYRTY